jgi:penicillin amidase
MLSEKEKFGIEDFKRMVLDQHSDYAALMTPFIIKLNERKDELSSEELSALAYLTGWDYDMKGDLIAPTIFEFFRMSFAKKLLADELGNLFEQLIVTAREYYIYRILSDGPDEWVDDISTPEKESLDDIVLKSFKDCILSLTEQYGNDHDNWKWSAIHKITIEHPLGSVKILDIIFGLNSDEFGIGGSNHTVSPYSYGADFKVNHGASERHIFNTADWDESLTVIPTGASGIPASEFYLSQTKSYLEGKFYKDAFSEKAVKAAAIYTLVLKAGK